MKNTKRCMFLYHKSQPDKMTRGKSDFLLDAWTIHTGQMKASVASIIWSGPPDCLTKKSVQCNLSAFSEYQSLFSLVLGIRCSFLTSGVAGAWSWFNNLVSQMSLGHWYYWENLGYLQFWRPIHILQSVASSSTYCSAIRNQPLWI